jgi:hypothetical protein
MKLALFPRPHFRSSLRFTIASAWSLACLLPRSALIASEPLAKGIQDNSFFIEEAYNQELGVVQHIFNLPIVAGKVHTDFGDQNFDRARSAVIQSDGRIVAAGFAI